MTIGWSCNHNSLFFFAFRIRVCGFVRPFFFEKHYLSGLCLTSMGLIFLGGIKRDANVAGNFWVSCPEQWSIAAGGKWTFAWTWNSGGDVYKTKMFFYKKDSSRWWFQIVFFHPSLQKRSNLTCAYFSNGWLIPLKCSIVPEDAWFGRNIVSLLRVDSIFSGAMLLLSGDCIPKANSQTPRRNLLRFPKIDEFPGQKCGEGLPFFEMTCIWRWPVGMVCNVDPGLINPMVV